MMKRRTFFFLSLLCCNSNAYDTTTTTTTSTTTSPIPVIIDSDPGALLRVSLDVDDDLALLYAFASRDQLDILGITVTFGNAYQCQTYADAMELVRLAGVQDDIPVFSGASKKGTLHESTPASRFIIDTILARANADDEDKITIVSLGVPSNVAAAITQNPSILDHIERIVVMGGFLDDRGSFELNFDRDPMATNALLNADVPKVVISQTFSLLTAFGFDELKQINDNENRDLTVVNKFMGRLTAQIYLWLAIGNAYFPPRQYPEKATDGFYLWDIFAVAILTEPELFGDFGAYQAQHVDGVFVPMEITNPTTTNVGTFLAPRALLDEDGFKAIFMEKILSITSNVRRQRLSPSCFRN